MKTIVLIIFFLLQTLSFAQSPAWHELPGAPFNTLGTRHEDTYFLNSSTGWVINIDGHIYKTTSGGNSWDTVASLGRLLRSTGFFDANTGIVGTLSFGSTLFRTTNGGMNWTDITSSIQGTVPRGICGISIVNQTTAYASGVYNNPAGVIKTTNAGANWTSLPMDTSLVRSLVDCYFWSPDSGIVVGGYSEYNVFSVGNSVILMTTNGGSNWNRVYVSIRTHEWCWKICFISRQIGFVSIEGTSPAHYLKTTDGGFNWTDKPFINNYDIEGIGFVNENTGWIGGHTGPTYETNDAGTTWHLSGWGDNVNRVRFLSDTLAYSVGQTVYKYTREPIGIQPVSTEIPRQFSLSQNYPNPFNPETKIQFSIPNAGNSRDRSVLLTIYNSLGQEVTTLVNEQLKAGIYEVNWDASDYTSGIYFYKLQTEGFTQSKKLILLK